MNSKRTNPRPARSVRRRGPALRPDRAERRRSSPLVEQLESRQLLSNVFWDGGAGTFNWNDAANWSNDMVPNAGADVAIDIPGLVATIVIDGNSTKNISTLISEERIRVTDGKVRVNGFWQQNQRLFLDGGEITGPGDVFVARGMTWTSGTISSSGNVILDENAVSHIMGSVDLKGSLMNDGVLTWISGNIRFTNGTLVNRPAGYIFMNSDGAALDMGGTNLIGNNSTLLRAGAAQEGTRTDIAVPINNTGDFVIDAGRVRFFAESNWAAGILHVGADDSALLLDNALFKVDSKIAGQGKVGFRAGTHFINGDLDVSLGELEVLDASVTIAKISYAGDITLSGGQIKSFQGITLLRKMDFFSGTITGPGELFVNLFAELNFLPDAKAKFQRLTISNFGELNLRGGVWRPIDGTTHNWGTINLFEGTINPVSGNSGIISGSGSRILKLGEGTVTATGNNGGMRVDGGNADLAVIEGTLNLLGNGFWNDSRWHLRAYDMGTESFRGENARLVLGGNDWSISSSYLNNTDGGTIALAGVVSVSGVNTWYLYREYVPLGDSEEDGFEIIDHPLVVEQTGTLLLGGTLILNESGIDVFGKVFNTGGGLVFGESAYSPSDGRIRAGGVADLGSFSFAEGASLTIDQGGKLNISAPVTIGSNVTLTNNGIIDVQDTFQVLESERTLTNLNRGVLTGGTWIIRGSMVDFGDGISENRATIRLDNGASWVGLNGRLEHNSGTIDLNNAALLTTPQSGWFFNDGVIDIDDGGEFFVDGRLALLSNSRIITHISSNDEFGGVGRVRASGDVILGGSIKAIFNSGFVADPGAKSWHFMESYNGSLLDQVANSELTGIPSGRITNFGFSSYQMLINMA